MTVVEPAFLKSLKNNKNRLLGIDLGDKTIGLSISDQMWFIGSPLETIRRSSTEKDLDSLQTIISKYSIVGIVIGLPINMNGTEGPQATKVREFVQQLETKFDIPVVLWDERLSTTAVTRTMLAADMSRSKRANVVDKLAASFILQGVLDMLSLR